MRKVNRSMWIQPVRSIQYVAYLIVHFARTLWPGAPHTTAWIHSRSLPSMRPNSKQSADVMAGQRACRMQMCQLLFLYNNLRLWHHEMVIAFPLAYIWQEWADVEGGILRATMAYCLARFQRNQDTRLAFFPANGQSWTWVHSPLWRDFFDSMDACTSIL